MSLGASNIAMMLADRLGDRQGTREIIVDNIAFGTRVRWLQQRGDSLAEPIACYALLLHDPMLDWELVLVLGIRAGYRKGAKRITLSHPDMLRAFDDWPAQAPDTDDWSFTDYWYTWATSC